ncbi:hypothetical protein ACFOW6_15855 [Fodinicurvata halophila]|uniref:Uncharacterized protein n=1 Tax=Fodinicurvata halophila TaxID=1419723 RepID=A0ABV8UQ18_9PROT
MTSRKTTSAGPSKGASGKSPDSEAVSDWEAEGGATPAGPTGKPETGRRGNALTRMLCRVFCPSSSKSRDARPSTDAS